MSVADSWGTTSEERKQVYPCDALAGDDWPALYRSVSVQARPATVFRWLCQLRRAPYSYDWLDNFGRRSPRTLTPGLDDLAVGQRVMTIFRLASFEPEHHLTVELGSPRSRLAHALVSYLVSADGTGSRLTAKIVARPLESLAGRALFRALAWGDLLMMRKQLLTLKSLAERDEGRQA